MPRMRTIEGLYREIRKMDPGSEISKHFLRRLVKSGKVKAVKAGNKYLVNLDYVLNYLSNPSDETGEMLNYGNLRKVSEIE